MKIACCSATVLLFLVGITPDSLAQSREERAEDLCENKIRSEYGVDRFREVSAESAGNHKWDVEGLVRTNHHNYDFHCKIKHGEVVSWSYHGPHNKGSGDSDVETAVAVGAGLAILAAIAASSDDDDDNGGSPNVRKSVLEDHCHDMLQYRIRDEHDYTANVTMQNSNVDGRDLKGKAKVSYDKGRGHEARYTCHFDGHGRLMDLEYRLHH